jgi:hypothetical protein
MYLKHQLSAPMWGRVQLLWLTLGFAALLVGGFAIWMGGFVRDNIQDELSSQQISFPTLDAMTEHELAIEGMEENASKPLENGNQAKVYASYILLHMNESAEEAGYPGATYATIGPVQRELRADLAAAEEAGDQAAIDEAQAELDEVTGLRNSMLNGSNLRGQLLSAYGWDQVGIGIFVAGFAIIAMSVMFFLLFFFERKRGHLPLTPRG